MLPNYLKYHKSLTNELHSLKDRIRDLTEHWVTDGEYKEAALRAVLRRHLPSSLIIGRGFVVTPDRTSTQIDLMIVDGSKPTLFRDGDLMFVTPDCVKAIIEVKTSLPTLPDLENACVKLARNGQLCQEYTDRVPWLGVFSYEGALQSPEKLVDALSNAGNTTAIMIDCVAYGRDRLVRLWYPTQIDNNEEELEDGLWRVYEVKDVASSYFIGHLLDSLSTLDRRSSSFAWYPLENGTQPSVLAERDPME